VLSPHAIVVVATAPVLGAFVAALAGPWWATAAIAVSLSIAALTETDERREQRLRDGTWS
jgi:hypothetical protein